MMEVQWLHLSGDENVRMRNWCAFAFGPTWIMPCWCGVGGAAAAGGGGGGGWPCILAPGGGTTAAPSGCEYSSDEGERSDADAFDRDEPTLSRLAAAAAAPRESCEARWAALLLLSNPPRPCSC